MPPETTATEAQPIPPGPNVDHVVIAVHGIRTFGNWQGRLKAMLEDQPGLEVHYYRYGYFSSIAFLVPFLRWLTARRFRFWLNEEFRLYPNARIDVVAHSFGTYLVSKCVDTIPQGRSIHTLIFAGSVLKPSFPWAKYLGEGGTVHRFINDCGDQDSILVLSQLFALGMGMAGRVGFGGIQSNRFLNRYFAFGHGGYFDGVGDVFMRQWWLPLLTSDAVPVPHDCREERPLTPLRGALQFLLNNAEPVKLMIATGLLLLIVGAPIAAHRQKQALDKVRRYAYITRLANAAQMPMRDPEHVRELLRHDLDGLPDTIPLQTESRTGASEAMAASTGPNDLKESWWDSIPFFNDLEKRAFIAMDLHARANAELAVRDANQVPDRTRARVLYEQALDKYQSVKDQARGSYALCLLDYGRLLSDLGVTDEAIANFNAIRTHVFPESKPKPERTAWSWLGDLGSWLTWSASEDQGELTGCPRSLQVDALCGEAIVFRSMKEFDASRKRLNDAESVGLTPERSPLLLAQVYNERAWTELDLLDLSAAADFFSKGLEQCEVPAVRDTFVAKRLSYHLQHGQAIVLRYQGRPIEAREHFDELVQQLYNELSLEYVLTPKQRRDLRDRMVNSMQRRGDCDLFRFNPKDPLDKQREAAWKAFALYEAAYRWTPSDDEDTRIILLLRMYLSRFLAGPTCADQEAARILLEAQRAFERLNPERRATYELDYFTAQACARFQFAGKDNRPIRSDEAVRLVLESVRPRMPGEQGHTPLIATSLDGDPLTPAPVIPLPISTLRKQALDDLRRHIRRNGAHAQELTRDRVEMLLLGTKVLLDDRTLNAVTGTTPEQSHRDATIINDLMGAALRGSQHPELEEFVRPLQEITASVMSRKAPADSSRDSAEAVGAPVTAPSPGTLPVGGDAVIPPPPSSANDGAMLFFWRLSPSLAITAIRGRPQGALPGPAREALAPQNADPNGKVIVIDVGREVVRQAARPSSKPVRVPPPSG